MSSEKRPAQDDPASTQLVKRPNLGTSAGLMTRTSGAESGHSAMELSVFRSQGLQPTVTELSGHTGEVFAAKFDPAGRLIASGSMDRRIFLWNSDRDYENYGVLTGHKSAVLDLQWSRDSSILFSASADSHLASWDLESGVRIRRYVGHEEIVNAVDVGKRGGELLVSASDDSSIGIWDPRSKTAVDNLQADFPVTAVAVSEAGNEIYSGGIDNDIRVWDVRSRAVVYSMAGHSDTVTSLRVSPDSQSLLSFSMDSTARTWDIRPFAPVDRHIRSFDGADAGLERNLVRASWEPNGKRIAAGSGDGTVVVWASDTGKMTYKLPGHRGAVNCAEFSPKAGTAATLLSASSDRRILVGDLR